LSFFSEGCVRVQVLFDNSTGIEAVGMLAVVKIVLFPDSPVRMVGAVANGAQQAIRLLLTCGCIADALTVDVHGVGHVSQS
jgi:hypothetical protein